MSGSKKERNPKKPAGVKRKPRKRMSYAQAVKVLVKHKIIRSKRDLEQQPASSGFLLGAI